MLGVAAAAVMVLAASQISFADDQGNTAVFEPAGMPDPVTLENLMPIDHLYLTKSRSHGLRHLRTVMF